MNDKELGKISDIHFGLCGYQECQLGLSIQFEGKGWGCGFTKAYWDKNQIKVTPSTQWTEKDRVKWYYDTMCYLSDLLKQAGVDEVHKLKGKPVEVTFENNTLKSWRLLTEVL